MISVKRFLPRVKKYLRESLGASFIIGFQVLLLACVGLLIVGNSVWADGLATVAYFSLVIGVVLQLISQRISPRIHIRIHRRKYFLRRGKQGEDGNE